MVLVMRLPMGSGQRTLRFAAVCGAIVAAGAALTACGSAQQGEGQTFDALKARTEAASSAGRDYDSVGQAVALTAAGGPSAPALAVVRGDVTAVAAGVSKSWELTDEGEETTILPFGDEAAESSTYHLTIDVDEVIAQGPTAKLGRTVTVGIALPPSLATLDQVRTDFEQVDDAVFFIKSSRLYDYAPNVLGIAENGTLIGFVNDGSITYPLIEQPTDSFTADGRDVAALKAAARR